MTQKTIKSVRRVFEILELFDKERRPLAAKEVSKQLGYPLVSTHELLKSMHELGYADFDQPHWTYIPSRSFVSLLEWVPDILERERNLLDFVEELNRQSQETVNVSRQVNARVRIIHGLESLFSVGVSVRVGAMMPIAQSLTGLTMMAAMEEEQREALITRIEQDDPAVFADYRPELLQTTVEKVQSKGFATEADLFIQGVGAVCFPVRTADGFENLVIGVVGPSDRINANASEYERMIKTLVKQFQIKTAFPLR